MNTSGHGHGIPAGLPLVSSLRILKNSYIQIGVNTEREILTPKIQILTFGVNPK
jgi:hypothetical protein